MKKQKCEGFFLFGQISTHLIKCRNVALAHNVNNMAFVAPTKIVK